VAGGLAPGRSLSPAPRACPRPGSFHDITTGNNTVTITSTSPPVTITGYQAAPGWDPVTGWGTPDAQILVPLLARDGPTGAP
jgi:hypothetical protein